MSILTPEGDIAAWLVGQTIAATNIGTFDGTPATGTAPALSIDGLHYQGSIGFINQTLDHADQPVSFTFTSADTATARVLYQVNYGNGASIGGNSTQVIGYSSTQFLAEGYSTTILGTQSAGSPVGFDSEGQTPVYLNVFSRTPLTAQDAAYYAGGTVSSFTFPSTGNTTIPEPSSVALLAAAAIAVVAARAFRSLRDTTAAV